jgi:hypothetical protein
MMTNDTTELLETLILSSRYGDDEDIRACLDAGAPVNGQDDRGSTGKSLFV